MKILMIGGTGTISSAITRQLAAAGHDLWLLNRGTRKNEVPAGVTQIIADIDDEKLHATCDCLKVVPASMFTSRRLRLTTSPLPTM